MRSAKFPRMGLGGKELSLLVAESTVESRSITHPLVVERRKAAQCFFSGGRFSRHEDSNIIGKWAIFTEQLLCPLMRFARRLPVN